MRTRLGTGSGRVADSSTASWNWPRGSSETNTGNPRGKLTVQVAVGAAGKPVIKQVFLDGKPYAEAMRQQKQP